MTNQELIERYVYAVSKHLPKKIRDDVTAELKSLINDTVQEKFPERKPTEKDIKLLLIELGSPYEVAMNYCPDKNKYVIGPAYYGKYVLILRIVLIASILGITVSAVITTAIEGIQSPWYIFILHWLGVYAMSIINAFAVTTFVFAAFQRKDININHIKFNPNNLPPVPNKQEKIGFWEPIMGIVFSIIFLIILLIAPEIIAIYNIKNGVLQSVTPILNVEVLDQLLYAIIAFFALGIIREAFTLFEGRYSKKLALVTGITNVLTIIITYIIVQNKIINPELINNIQKALGQGNDFLIQLVYKAPLILFILISLLSIIDFAVVLIKASNQA